MAIQQLKRVEDVKQVMAANRSITPKKRLAKASLLYAFLSNQSLKRLISLSS